MTLRAATFAFISSLAISLSAVLPVNAQQKKAISNEVAEDSTAFFNGFAVSADLVGLVQYAVSDYGQFEGALRLNLLDKYFPTVEIGVGRANSEDDITRVIYKTTAPYFRIGCDYNLAKDKHDIYRILGGLRYAFTSFKFDVSRPGLVDAKFGGEVPYGAEGVSCNFHWVEAVLGVDAKLWGPIHLGWFARYRKRLSHSHLDIGNEWYVPGFGETGSSIIGATFNLTIDI